jgi:selenocysteine lyase/cysteine desulfurase
MAPRGLSLAYLAPAARERLRPIAANWYAAADPPAAYYGLPMDLAPGARAFDLSPAWFNNVAAAPALELLADIGVPAVHRHNTALADRFRTGLGLPPATGPTGPTGATGAIVAADLARVPDAPRRLAAAGVRAAVRGGRLRASFHLYTTDADVDRALEALA